MELNKQRIIPADQAAVWAALNDNQVLQACLPGCESLTQVDETTRTALVVAAIGPVRAKFTGTLSLENIQAPNGYSMVFEAQGGAAGFSKGTANVQLQTLLDGSTELSYQASVQIGGKLAQLGSRIVEGASQKIIDAFFANFEAALTAPAPEPEPEAVQQAAQGMEPNSSHASTPATSWWQRVLAWLGFSAK